MVDMDTGSKLIAAAAPLFARKGFAAVSIRELAEAAGVNVAAISYHFGGKEALYAAVLEDQFVPIAEALEKIHTVENLPPEERLSVYAHSIVGIHQQRPYLMRFMHSELTNPTGCFAVVKKYISQVYAFLYSTLEQGVTEGQFKAGLDISLAALALAGIMNFFYIGRPMAKEFISSFDDAEVIYNEQSFAIYLDGIRRRHDE